MGNSGVEQRGQTEKQDEPGPLDAGFTLQGDRGDERERDDPESAGEFDGGADGESGGAVFGGGAYDGTGVVNGESRPEPELRLGHVQGVSDEWKQEEGNRVEDEDGAQGDSHLFFAGIGNGTDGGDGAATANGGAGADEEGGLFSDLQQIAEAQAEQHRDSDAGGGVDEAGASGVENLMEVHAEAEGNDGSLQEKFREALAFGGGRDERRRIR